jgi:hypothetical protein
MAREITNKSLLTKLETAISRLATCAERCGIAIERKGNITGRQTSQREQVDAEVSRLLAMVRERLRIVD